MKRSAFISPVHSNKQPRPTRSTRLAERQREDHEQKMLAKLEIKSARAHELMATPLLQALPMVFSSGFLYKAECRSPALACKNFHAIWVEAQENLPPECLVKTQVHYAKITEAPVWVKASGLESVLPSQEFGRAIFDKMCELKVKAETSERKKEKMRESLPKWGVDFVGIYILAWGPLNGRNSGGIYFALKKFHSYEQSGNFPMGDLCGWRIRLDNDLCLWTWDK